MKKQLYTKARSRNPFTDQVVCFAGCSLKNRDGGQVSQSLHRSGRLFPEKSNKQSESTWSQSLHRSGRLFLRETANMRDREATSQSLHRSGRLFLRFKGQWYWQSDSRVAIPSQIRSFVSNYATSGKTILCFQRRNPFTDQVVCFEDALRKSTDYRVANPSHIRSFVSLAVTAAILGVDTK